MLDVIWLSGADEPRVAKWLAVLSLPETMVFRPAEAASVVWRGSPFIVAGTQDDLNKWFSSHDEHTTRVLADCAYFWILTGSGNYHHKMVPRDRSCVLEWHRQDQHIVRDAISMLQRFPDLCGLSKGLRHVREEILRVARGPKGPSTPVLILGASGSGKEEVAHAVVRESPLPDHPGMYCFTGASLNLEPDFAAIELFGIDKETATLVRQRPGLVEKYSAGALLIDDFDAAPRVVQEQLLRMTSVRKNQQAPFRRLGGSEDKMTGVWLLFATNADIQKMVAQAHLRADFLYRFEDRVIVIPPLRDRPADLPAIAYRIWSDLIKESDGECDDRVLPWQSLRSLCTRELSWDGNVRELSALLRLVVSMARMPQHRHHSTGALIDQVLARGSNYNEWFFQTVTSPDWSGAPSSALPSRTKQLLKFDAGPIAEDGLSPCEVLIKQKLRDHWLDLDMLAGQRAPTEQARIRRHLCRYLLYALQYDDVSIADAEKLGGIGNAQARKHLQWLAEQGSFLSRPKNLKANTKLSYKLGKYFDDESVHQNP